MSNRQCTEPRIKTGEIRPGLPRAPKTLSALFALAAIGLLSGCSAQTQTVSTSLPQPAVSAERDRMRFNISVSFDSLSQKPAFDTEAIEAAYLLLAGRESVWALIEPSSEAGVSALPAIAAQLQQLGVTSDRMIILFEPVLRSEGGGDIQVTLDRYRATTTGCHGWSRPNLLNNPTLPSGNFGCASAQNLAGMIADPRDLVAPRKLAPADAYREAGAVGNYREGELPEFVELDTSTTD